MSEIEREAILAERLEQMQKIQDRRKLQEMIRQQKGASNDADSVAKAAKRIQCFLHVCMPSSYTRTSLVGQHAVRGATKEKSRKLDELKAKRRAKDEKKRVCWLTSRNSSLSHPSVRYGRILLSVTALHRPWKWRPPLVRKKMVKLPNTKKRRKGNAGCIQSNLSLTTNL